MNITEKNIEEVLFDYVEGNLSSDQISEVDHFIELNPKYKDDLEAWKLASINVTQFEFPLKQEIAQKASKPDFMKFGLMGLEFFIVVIGLKMYVSNLQGLEKNHPQVTYLSRNAESQNNLDPVDAPQPKKVASYVKPAPKAEQDTVLQEDTLNLKAEEPEEIKVAEAVEETPKKDEEPVVHVNKPKLSKLKKKLMKEDVEITPSLSPSTPEVIIEKDVPEAKEVPKVEVPEKNMENKKDESSKPKKKKPKKKFSIRLDEGDNVKVIPLENSGF